jgi:FkbM family methyltransferase
MGSQLEGRGRKGGKIVAVMQKFRMFVWYFKATKSIRSMFWITALAVMRLPRKHAPGINKAKLLADVTTKICEKEIVMHTSFGTFYGNMSIVANINPLAEAPTCSAIADNIERNWEREPKVFVNVGAHVGRYLVDLTKNYGYESYGFEPTPSTYKHLMKNALVSCDWTKFHLFNFGLGDENTVLDFYESTVCGFNTFCADQKVLNMEKTQVPVKRFDDLDLKINPKDVALMLIDAEGFEFKVLKGMKKFLKELDNVDIIIEIHETSGEAEDIMSYMKAMSFISSPIDSANWLFRKS